MTDEKESEAERKRRLRAKVFGEVLPDTTTDESRDEEPSNDEWLKRQVPPHHG
ncbi:MAG TPA: hypothetical protein VLI04_19980 [Nocardioidaceae bacterium]|nr:hypothetical protein [Nocardioidaceae bacterium]